MRREPLLAIGDPALISSGLAPDRHAILQPLWEAASNVRFYQGKVRRLFPAALITGIISAATAYSHGKGILQLQDSTGTRWIYSFHQNPSTHSMIIQRWFAGAPELIENAAQERTLGSETVQAYFPDPLAWGDWVLYVNGNGTVRRYRPDTGLDNLPNAPANVLGLIKKNNQIMAIGVGPGRRQVAWSDADDITTWAAAADNLAGSLTIEELDTPLRAYTRLGQHVACYAEDQMAVVRWIGAPYYFGQQVALEGIGAVGKKAVCADGRLNYGFSRNGAWQTDGNEYRYIDQGILSDYLQANINWNRASLIIVVRNDVTRCIEFHFPMGVNDKPSEAWSYDPSTGSWAPVVPSDYVEERKLFRKPIAQRNSDLVLLDDNPAVAGALLLRTKPLIISTEESSGLHLDCKIDEIELAAHKASGVQFRFGNATDIDGPWAWSQWQNISPDLRTYRLENMPTGTYHKLEFQSTATNWDLDLQGFTMFGAIEGTKRDTL